MTTRTCFLFGSFWLLQLMQATAVNAYLLDIYLSSDEESKDNASGHFGRGFPRYSSSPRSRLYNYTH